MEEESRPTGITYKDAVAAAKRGGSIDFEGRKVRVVNLRTKAPLGELHTAHLDLDLGHEYLTLVGYWSGDGELMETGRENPF